MQLKNFKKCCFTSMIDFLEVLRFSYPVSSLSPARPAFTAENIKRNLLLALHAREKF